MTTNPKTLLLGGSGQLGSELRERLAKSHEVLAPSHSEVDLTNCRAYVLNEKPQLVINTAAFHVVPACETERDRAFALNAAAVGALAECCAEMGARFLTFSTDYVFSGEKRVPYVETDEAGPLQVYGESKLAGERLALSKHPQGAFVIRTCGLYGRGGSRQKGGNFLDQRIADTQRLDTIEVGNDQTVSPTYAFDLAEAVTSLLALGAAWKPGVYHLVNEGQCTWYDLTQEAFRVLGLKTRVLPVDRGGRTGSMRRPLFSALLNTKAAALGVRLPTWQSAVARYLQNCR